jgi:hypothetical protein
MARGSLALLYALRFWLQDWLDHAAWNLQAIFAALWLSSEDSRLQG